MTGTRAGARTVAAVLSLVVASGVVVGCSSSTPAPTPRTVALASPVASVAVSASPGASGSPAPSASPGLGLTDPDRTLPPDMAMWPESVINATIALAALDNEIKKAGADLIVATDTQDMALLLGAARGLASIAELSIPNAETLTTYPVTVAVGQEYVPVLTALDISATALADALARGDGAAVASTSQDLAAAMQAYGVARPALIDLADLALLMRKGMLVK